MLCSRVATGAAVVHARQLCAGGPATEAARPCPQAGAAGTRRSRGRHRQAGSCRRSMRAAGAGSLTAAHGGATRSGHRTPAAALRASQSPRPGGNDLQGAHLPHLALLPGMHAVHGVSHPHRELPALDGACRSRRCYWLWLDCLACHAYSSHHSAPTTCACCSVRV